MGISTNNNWQWWYNAGGSVTYTYTNNNSYPVRLTSISVKYGSGGGTVYPYGTYTPNTTKIAYDDSSSPTKLDAIEQLRSPSNYSRTSYTGPGAAYNLQATLSYNGVYAQSQVATVSTIVFPQSASSSYGFDASGVSYTVSGYTSGYVNYSSGSAIQQATAYSQPSVTTTLTFDYSSNDIVIPSGQSANVVVSFTPPSGVYAVMTVLANLTGEPSVVEANAQAYTLTYTDLNADSGTAPSSVTKTSGETFTVVGNTGNLARNNASQAGTAGSIVFTSTETSTSRTISSTCTVSTTYAFKNWISGTTEYNSGDTITANANVTLNPNWTATALSPTYASVTAPSDFTRTGYTLKGWATTSGSSTVAYNPGATVPGSASATYYAVWEATTYTISYTSGDATSGTPPTAQSKSTGGSVTIKSNSDLAKTVSPSQGTAGTIRFVSSETSASRDLSSACTINKTYAFRTWLSDSTEYAPGSTYSADANLTLVPAWTETQTQTYASVIAPSDFTRTDYTLAGWAETQGGSVVYQPSATVPGVSSKTYYAVWTRTSGEVKVRSGSTWVSGSVKARVNGQWVTGVIYYRSNGQWVRA